jgi:putative sterol carrier protein
MSMTRDEIAGIFPEMVAHFNPDKAQGVDARIQFDLSGDNGGNWWLKINQGQATTGEGQIDSAQMTVRSKADDFVSMINGSLNPMQAFMSGKIKVQGDMGMAMRFMNMFNM